MRPLARAALFAVLGFLVAPLFAADEKKADDKKDVDKKGPELVSFGPPIVGKILFVDETKRTLKLQISIPELNQGEVQAYANDQNEIQKVLLTEKNPQTRANRIQQG